MENRYSRLFASLRHWTRRTDASASVELLIVLPVLFWALAASVVFYDGFRARYQAQLASQTLADLLSRETAMLDGDYVEGLNNVFDFLSEGRFATQMRVSSVIWDPSNNRHALQWSYGTRSLLPLPQGIFTSLETGSVETVTNTFRQFVQQINNAQTNGGFVGNVGSTLIDNLNGPLVLSEAQLASMLPDMDLADRIPPVLPGESIVLVETIVPWSPGIGISVGDLRFDQVVAVRPRFAPFINFANADPVYPVDTYEVDWSNRTGDDQMQQPDGLPDDDDDDDEHSRFARSASHDGDDDDDDDRDGRSRDDDDDDDSFTVVMQSFDNGVTTGWTQTTITQNGPDGAFLGPFGRETRAAPVYMSVDLGRSDRDARIDFDLILLDDWNGFNLNTSDPGGDALRMLIGNHVISMDAFDRGVGSIYGHTREATVFVGQSLVRITMQPETTGYSFVGQPVFHDQVWQVSMRIQNPPQSFSLGFSGALNHPIPNEAFGIDNFRVERTDRSGSSYTAPQPADADYMGFDPVTGIPQWRGCPDARLPSPFINIESEDLNNTFEIERNAGGGTNLSQCASTGGSGYVNASPDLVVNYDASQSTPDLRISAHDGYNQTRCDTVLMVRDTHGQWLFNDNANGSANPEIVITDAPSGRYTVWLGTAGANACDSRIRVRGNDAHSGGQQGNGLLGGLLSAAMRRN